MAARIQALVVGAGPVGLTMAAELARYGVTVRIVDKAPARTDKSKALVLWSRTLELLDRAGASQVFVDAGRKVTAANIVAAGKQIGHIEMDGIDTPYPYALMIPQSETERLLDEHLATYGVAVERQVEMTSFTHDEAGVTAVLRDANGVEATVTADWLIGCDGAHSVVRHGLGFTFAGDTLLSDWVLADVHLEGDHIADTEISTYWNEHGVLVIFPITQGRFRVIADMGVSVEGPPPMPTREQIQALMDLRGPGGITAVDPIWLSGFRINERKVTDYRAGRVFIAGDAAHVHSPAGGQGMNTGMQDAFNLAWKLALVSRGTCSEELLASYSVERSAVGDEVLQAAGKLTAVATMRNHAAQVVRNAIGRVLLGLTPVRRFMVESMSEVSVGYDKSPLNGPAAHVSGPVPGERLRPVCGQVPVGSGGVPLFGLFADASDAASDLVARFEGLVDPDIRPPITPGGTWLVRPDGYVACVAKAGNVEAIAGYLESLR